MIAAWLAALCLYQSPADAPKVSAKLHADVVALMEISDERQNIRNRMEAQFATAKQQMQTACKGCDPQFADEWVKRMRARLKIEDLLAVTVRTYEKFLNDDIVLQLIELQKLVKKKETAVPSDDLKQKLSEILPAMSAELMGEFTKVGAKLGGEVGQEIEKEHPEWVKPAPKPER